MLILGPKNPTDIRNLGGDFTDELAALDPSTTILSCGCAIVQVYSGVDPATPPAFNLTLEGAAVLNGNIVVQKFGGGLDGVSYLVAYTVVLSDGETLVRTAVVKVSIAPC